MTAYMYDLTLFPPTPPKKPTVFPQIVHGADTIRGGCSKEAGQAAQAILMGAPIQPLWQSMETAPTDRRILLRRDWNAGPGIGRWVAEGSNHDPAPYWGDDRQRQVGIAILRRHTPTGWMELPQ